MVDGEFPVRVLRQVLECDLWLAFPYHEMDDNQTLEDNCPCRVAQAVREGAKDLSDACLAGMRRDQNVFDIFGLGRGKL